MAVILVTGGCGYIGSHTVVDLIKQGFDVISIDNLSRSSDKVLDTIESLTGVRITNHKVDLTDHEKTKATFKGLPKIDGIIHFAAYKTVPESVAHPLRYFHNNLQSLVNILAAAGAFEIPHFVFSSSCSVYGNAETLPVTESTPLGEAASPYARTKQMGEDIIKDFTVANPQLKSVSLRYFNPIGAHESGIMGETPITVPDNLVPYITQTAIGKRDQLTVFGGDYDTRDGSCVRDYIDIMDLAAAHTKALQFLLDNKGTANPEIINLGSGNGVTVLEAVKAFEKVNQLQLNYVVGERRPGDVVSIYADNSKARQVLGWSPERTLEDSMKSAWKWEQNMALQKSSSR